MRRLVGGDVVGQRLLQVAPRARLVAQMVPGGADHPLADRTIVRLRVRRRDGQEFFRQGKRGRVPAPNDVNQPEAS